MKIFFLATLLATTFFSCVNYKNKTNTESIDTNPTKENMGLDFDLIDAYKLKFGKARLYGDFNDFVVNVGLPDTLQITKNEFGIHSRAELNKLIATATDTDAVILRYKGFEMDYGKNNFVVPWFIDFRKTNLSVSYGETSFDTTYTLEQFAKQFPLSAKPPNSFGQSLFGTVTKETGANLQHRILLRKSRDDPDAKLWIEFTFKEGKLIFILFMNVN